MKTEETIGVAPRLTATQWLICIIASIGFAFDTYELLVLPLIVRPALTELGKLQFGSPAFGHWRDLLFYVPAMAGGIFGLLGGYLTDRLGRRRVLVWSILLYALSALAAGFTSSLPWLLFFRCTTFIGVCVEFVAAVAWLAELFPHPKQRESVLGYTQAFSSFGGLLVSLVYVVVAKYSGHLPAIHGEHEPWRYILISGLIPAIPLLVIRPFLPESPLWSEKKEAGTLARPSFAELFKPEFRRTTIVTTLMFACSFGAAFGAIQQLPQIVPGLAEVRSLPKPEQQPVVGTVQTFQEVGGLVGRFALAFLAIRILSRRRLLRTFQVPGLIIVPLVFLWPAVHSLALLKVGIFLAGFFTVAQFSFWGNYLPRVYPTHLRGTGESFAANIGGRMIGTGGALVTSELALAMPASPLGSPLALAAGAVGTGSFLIALLASAWLREPEGELPD